MLVMKVNIIHQIVALKLVLLMLLFVRVIMTDVIVVLAQKMDRQFVHSGLVSLIDQHTVRLMPLMFPRIK